MLKKGGGFPEKYSTKRKRILWKVTRVSFIISFRMISIIPITVNDRFFGIEIDQVVEIITQKEFFLVPKVPEFTIGLVNIRGEIVPVFSLSSILFGKKAQMTELILQNLVVCRVNEKKLCFFVDKIYKVVYVKEENIKNYAENIWKDVKFIKYFVEIEEFENLIGVLDVENIVNYIDNSNREFYKAVRR
ncbi:MAG: chemotaxis protein CheW [Brevinematia bacterium]